MFSSRFRKVFSPLVLIVVLVVSSSNAFAAPKGPVLPPAPADDSFYTPPSPLPIGAPGDVIRVRPAKAGPPAARAMADAWQVMYLSTNALGQPDAVTGIILTPKSVDRSKTPIVAFAPGTQGPAFRCTPSKVIDSGSFYEQSAVNEMLQKGYAIAIPDWEGYRQDPKATYIVGKSMGAALMDVVRAAQRLPETGLARDAKVVFRGFSQGGGGAMWAGQMHPSYAPELNLIGVVGGGVPANLGLMGISLEGADAFGFVLNALMGLDNAYPELKLAAYLNDAGRAALADLNQNGCALELLLDYKGKGVLEYMTANPLSKGAWLARIAENKLGANAIKVPVLQYHSTSDDIVPFDQAETLREAYCMLQVNLTWKTFDGIDHVTMVSRGSNDAMAFIAARLAGTPATTNC